jgi:hypothetical protein
MPCLLLLLILFFPRVVLVLMGLFTHYFGIAYPHFTFFVALGGFLFVPLTTVVYAWIVVHNPGYSHEVAGLNLVWLGLALIIDLSGWGGGLRSRRR